MPTGSSHLSFTMAALVSAGGIAGFAKAKSIPSLSAGLFFGGLFVGAGYLINVRTRCLNFRFQKGDVIGDLSLLLSSFDMFVPPSHNPQHFSRVRRTEERLKGSRQVFIAALF